MDDNGIIQIRSDVLERLAKDMKQIEDELKELRKAVIEALDKESLLPLLEVGRDRQGRIEILPNTGLDSLVGDLEFEVHELKATVEALGLENEMLRGEV